MIDKKNIISTMTSQHRVLENEVGSILEIIKKNEVDIEKISQGLEWFKKDLIEHLKLENEVFYVELLKDMKNKGQDFSDTEKFIKEMDDIAKVVIAFLEKYKNIQSIKEKIDEFKKEFFELVSVLALRIESEEDGVYSYWK